MNKKNRCLNCGKKIKVSIFRNGEWCCGLCRKALGKDIPNPKVIKNG